MDCIICNSDASDSNYSGPTCKSCYKKQYYLANKESIKSRRMVRYGSNKEKEHEYQRNRKRTDPAFRAACKARDRVFKLMSGTIEASSSIGCTQKEFKKHIESQFQQGMSWDNYGNLANQWNIDHIYPLSRAFKEGAESFKKACHYSNMRPMWSLENRSKGNKV